MSADTSSSNQQRVNIKEHANIERPEDDNHIITSYGQPISNIFEEEQVCIHNSYNLTKLNLILKNDTCDIVELSQSGSKTGMFQ
jgi:hypothetical protein